MNGFFGISLLEKLTGRSFTVHADEKKGGEVVVTLPPAKK